MSPALAAGFLTTAPPGKSPSVFISNVCQITHRGPRGWSHVGSAEGPSPGLAGQWACGYLPPQEVPGPCSQLLGRDPARPPPQPVPSLGAGGGGSGLSRVNSLPRAPSHSPFLAGPGPTPGKQGLPEASFRWSAAVGATRGPGLPVPCWGRWQALFKALSCNVGCATLCWASESTWLGSSQR